MAHEAPSGLLDTSVFIAAGGGRDVGRLPERAAVSVVTLAELRLGVLMADDPVIRARRLHTLVDVEAAVIPLAIDEDVARTFAEIAAQARREGRRPKIMDLWIAATAVAHGMPVYTQDRDFAGIPQVEVIPV